MEDIELFLYARLRKEPGDMIDPKAFVQAMVEIGWFDVRENGIYIHDWAEYQEPYYNFVNRREREKLRYKEAKGRKSKDTADGSQPLPPEAGETPKLPQNPDGQTVMQEITPAGGILPAPPADEQKADLYEVGFEEFWAAYPRRIDRGNALKKYKARRKEGFSAEELIEAAENYAAECRRKHTGKEYIKHPKTFLSDSTPFVDYLPNRNQEATSRGYEIPEGFNPFAQYAGEEGFE